MHLPSIDQVVYLTGRRTNPWNGFPLRCLQRLSAPHAATRPCRWSTTGSPEVRPPLPLVLGAASIDSPAPTEDRDRTVSRRSEPSSRTALNGEQPYPWNLLQPQDAMSRHRGAKPCRRCGLLGKISLLSPEYLLSVEPWATHWGRRITRACFRTCSACGPRSQARLYSCIQKDGCRPSRADLRAPPLPFRRRPPQSNCPPGTGPEPVDGLGLGRRSREGSIPRAAPRGLAPPDRCLLPILYTRASGQCQAAVKVHGVFPSFRG